MKYKTSKEWYASPEHFRSERSWEEYEKYAKNRKKKNKKEININNLWDL